MPARTGNVELDIAVVGAGMIGCATAALFARLGLQVGLIDQNRLASWDEATYGPRVSAINPASSNLFRQLGVWDEIEKRRVSPYRHMCVWEDGTSARISFHAQELNLPELGHIVENNVVVSALAEKLAQNYNVRILEGLSITDCRYESERVVLETGTDQAITCSLVVGADGANSNVRQLSGIDTRKYEYGQDAIVTTVSVEKTHGETAWQSFLPSGPVALLPLANGNCSIVWSSDSDFSRNLMAMEDNSFGDALTDIFGNELGRVQPVDERLCFPLRQHHASQYIARHTALVGDAAHVTHPLAGLGANIGFMDAAALAETTGDAMDRGKGIGGHATLRRYERWRKGDNAFILEMMKGFKNLFGSSHGTVKTARRLGLSTADNLAPLKEMFALHATGLQGDVPRLCRAGHVPEPIR